MLLCGFSFALLVFDYLSSATVLPRLSENVPRRSQNVGTKLKLFCSIQEGTKPLEFEWRKNGKSLFSDNDKYRIVTDEEVSEMTIATLDRSDSANYSCTVRNKFGFDTQSTTLAVKGLAYFSF